MIQLNPASFDKYASGKRRPYTLVVFLGAKHLLDKPNLHLKELRDEFGYMAKTYKAQADGVSTKIYFAELDFTESQEVFRRLNAQSLFIFRLAPSSTVTPGENIKIKDQDMLRPERHPKQPVPAEDMVAFVRDRTGYDIGRVVKPAASQSWWFPFVALSFLSSLAYVGYKIMYADVMRNMLMYALATLLVYWFSVSGGMHNIIRGMPMVTINPQTKTPQYFMPGQGQLGTEGFVMGSLYTLVGLAFALVVYVAPKAKSASSRRMVAYGGLCVAFICFRQVVGLYTWKTGYHWRKYI